MGATTRATGIGHSESYMWTKCTQPKGKARLYLLLPRGHYISKTAVAKMFPKALCDKLRVDEGAERETHTERERGTEREAREV